MPHARVFVVSNAVRAISGADWPSGSACASPVFVVAANLVPEWTMEVWRDGVRSGQAGVPASNHEWQFPVDAGQGHLSTRAC